MTTSIGSTMKTVAITSNLAVLHAILANAAERSADAHALILRGEQNAAIGALLDLDDVLNDAKSLYGAALAMHRSKGL